MTEKAKCEKCKNNLDDCLDFGSVCHKCRLKEFFAKTIPREQYDKAHYEALYERLLKGIPAYVTIMPLMIGGFNIEPNLTRIAKELLSLAGWQFIGEKEND